MRDRLGTHAWVNRFPNNPTQTMFKRFIRQPASGLPDLLKDTRDKFSDFGKKALHTRLSEYLES